jgi:hypothetical protein
MRLINLEIFYATQVGGGKQGDLPNKLAKKL